MGKPQVGRLCRGLGLGMLAVQAVSGGAHCGSGGKVAVGAESHCPSAVVVLAGVNEGDCGLKDFELVEFQDFNAAAGVGKQVGAGGDGAGGADFAVRGGARTIAAVRDGGGKAVGGSAQLGGFDVVNPQFAGGGIGGGKGAPFHAASFFAQAARQLVAEASPERVICKEAGGGADRRSDGAALRVAVIFNRGGAHGFGGAGRASSSGSEHFGPWRIRIGLCCKGTDSDAGLLTTTSPR